MSPELIDAITRFITACGGVAVVMLPIYFKLRNKVDEVHVDVSSKVDEVHDEVNSRYTELFAKFEDMTRQRDDALDRPHKE